MYDGDERRRVVGPAGVFSLSLALSLITAVLGMMMFGGWFAWLATKVRRRRFEQGRHGEVGDPGSSRVNLREWDEPDLAAAPPTSAAGAEIAELERLWRLPAHHASAEG